MKLLALILIILSAPILAGVSLIILVLDRQSPFFKQRRVGLYRESFTIYKLQTFKNGSVTSLGGLLRKTGVDELPQLINILKGDMGFVGPRPLTQEDIIRLEWDKKDFDLRWEVLPGITGEAQLIRTCNASLSIKADLNFAENKTTMLCFKILLRSVLIPIVGKRKKI